MIRSTSKLIVVKKIFLFVLFFGNLAGIILIWWTRSGGYAIENPGGGNLLIALGRLAGLLGEYTLLVQLVLVGRIRPIEHLFGFDKLNKIHRWIGYSILTFLLSHPILLITGYAQANGVSLLAQYIDFLTNIRGVVLSSIALLFFIVIVIVSIVIIKKKLRYETWYFTHLFTYVAIGLAFQHQIGTADLRAATLYYWYALNFSVFASVLLYRFVRPVYLFTQHRFTIERVVQETPDVWSLYITGRKMDRFRFQSGQYANITILARGMWYTHPFSLSTAYNGQFIRFSIKSLGDFTSKIRDLRPGTRVIIDGSLGLFVAEKATREKILLIAGGIGITPLRSMVESLSRLKKNVVLLYANKTEKDIVFRKELEALQAQAPTFSFFYILATVTPGFESGYIDKEKIVRLVPDFIDREVFLCGPPLMMKSVLLNLEQVGFNAGHIHYEKFSF